MRGTTIRCFKNAFWIIESTFAEFLVNNCASSWVKVICDYFLSLLWQYSLAYACLKLVNYSFFFWLPFYLSNNFGWKEAKADRLSMWYDVGGIIGEQQYGYALKGLFYPLHLLHRIAYHTLHCWDWIVNLIQRICDLYDLNVIHFCTFSLRWNSAGSDLWFPGEKSSCFVH